jgi:hypothetical protein
MAVQAAAAVAWVASIGGSVASGYMIDRYLGDRNYTQKELATDVVLGALGVGIPKTGAKFGYAVYLSRKADQARKAGKIDDAKRLAEAAAMLERSGTVDLVKIGAVESGVSTAFPEKSGVSITPAINVRTPSRREDPKLLKKQLRAAKKGRFVKNRCNRKYRGKQCVKFWPHGGKHVYV